MSRILYLQYTNPAGYPPLQHSSRILADAGWSVLFLGTGSAGSDILQFPAHRNISVRRMAFRRAGWRQKLHFLAFFARAVWTALTWRPRWIYASEPLSCPAALLFTLIPGLRVVYHEHDSPKSNPGDNRFLRFISWTRGVLAKRADLCILPNAQRLERFERECGPVRAAACVWNCPSVSEAAAEPRSESDGPVWLLYHGSIVPERLPLTVLSALERLPAFVKLRVAGYETAGSRGYVAELRRRALAGGLESRVEFLDTIPERSDLLLATSKSDIGLALMPMKTADFNCETMTGASNKAFDYLACGLALIVSDLPDWREMFVEPGFALACDPEDPVSISAALSSLIEDRARMRTIGERGRQRILADWNYETAFKPVLDRLSDRRSAGAGATANGRLENVR